MASKTVYVLSAGGRTPAEGGWFTLPYGLTKAQKTRISKHYRVKQTWLTGSFPNGPEDGLRHYASFEEWEADPMPEVTPPAPRVQNGMVFL